MKHHPDVAKNDKDASAKFAEINNAYEVLKDKGKQIEKVTIRLLIKCLIYSRAHVCVCTCVCMCMCACVRAYVCARVSGCARNGSECVYACKKCAWQ